MVPLDLASAYLSDIRLKRGVRGRFPARFAITNRGWLAFSPVAGAQRGRSPSIRECSSGSLYEPVSTGPFAQALEIERFLGFCSFTDLDVEIPWGLPYDQS